MTFAAHAKLTLDLRVTGVRDDGFHLIDAEMVSLDVADAVTITPTDGESSLSVDGPYAAGVGTGADNLVLRALALATRRASVHLTKNIPHGGGLGGGVFGAVALQEFALALFVGLLTGAYSSIFIATPLLTIMKEREPKYRTLVGQRSLGADMTQLAQTGAPVSRRSTRSTARASEGGGVEPPVSGDGELVGTAAQRAAAVLSHPPRPRKKRRR